MTLGNAALGLLLFAAGVFLGLVLRPTPLLTPKPPKATTAQLPWPKARAEDVSSSLSINGTPYKVEEVRPGEWEWVYDKQSAEQEARWEARKAELFAAMQTRVLTDAELEEARGFGKSLNIQMMVPYMEADKQRELNEAWAQQHRLRAIGGGQ